MSKIYLVTGAAGFIASQVSKQLLDQGDHVVGVDNLNDYYDVNLKYARLRESGISNEAKSWNKLIQSNLHVGYSFIRMNLEDKYALNYLFQNQEFDSVINLAAQAGVRYSLENPDVYLQSNVIGFHNILEACRNYPVKHLLFASSSSVYGENKKVPFSITDNVDHPISLYAATKKANELMAHAYSHLYQLPTTGLRFFTVYGPWGRPDMALFMFTKAILEGEKISVYNYGNHRRDFTYIDDVIDGVENILLKPSKDKNLYKLYNIGNSQPVQLLDFIDTIEKSTGKTAHRIMMPMQAGDVSQAWANVAHLKTDYDYQPSTTLDVGVDAFVKWYKSYYCK